MKAQTEFGIEYSMGIGKVTVTVVAELRNDGLHVEAFTKGNFGLRGNGTEGGDKRGKLTASSVTPFGDTMRLCGFFDKGKQCEVPESVLNELVCGDSACLVRRIARRKSDASVAADNSST